MQHLWIFVKYLTYAMAAVFTYYAAVIFFCVVLNGESNITQTHAGFDLFDT